ncbi:hypothetical protein [Ramlibacter sp. PS4R-6]|uniref:hypothetical protein n=1 Tax=Ramlibacter sp. PS4R-6 TaxID=3133438 RepID=UPI0030A94DFE
MKASPLSDLSAPAKSVLVFGVYLLLLGALLVVAPNVVLGLFGIPPATEVWIRVVGMLVLVLGAYYALAAIAEVRAFMRWTVPIRLCVLLFFAAFVVTGLAPRVLILFGLVDVAGAAWTAWALRRAAAQDL